ncbi:NTP transferase domain-containing protein [Arcticibacter sp.]|uniref:nucleotidyltransferase family protein n=1 Tax=Arcticibacter sp. TaxID=1872630 RepID=UPI00388F32C7
MEDYAIIILAAGSSSRMGRAKQLLKIHDKTLLKHTIDEAKILLPSAVYVVYGANADAISSELASDSSISICYNASWREGMASSIKTGLKAVQGSNPSVKGCLISVCDQPFLTAQVFARLISAHEKTPRSIVASVYNDTAGVPVLFDSHYFPLLMALSGQEGAKKILSNPTVQVVHIPFPNGDIDLDTPGDYHRYLSNVTDKS